MLFAFSLVLLFIALGGAISLQKNLEIKNLSARVVELRTPTIRASTAMINGINQALAALRG